MAAASAARDGHLLLIRFAAMLCFSSLFPLLCGLAMAWPSATATVRRLETPTDAPQAQCTMLHTDGELSPRSATDVPAEKRPTTPCAYRKAMGYRVQVYTGFADRASRNAAIQMQKEICRRFPQMPVRTFHRAAMDLQSRQFHPTRRGLALCTPAARRTSLQRSCCCGFSHPHTHTGSRSKIGFRLNLCGPLLTSPQ